jgi:hypothetical protein
MARLNEILVGRFAKAYQRVFGMKGPVPVATLAPEIMPTHALFHGVEERYLETWNRYCVGVVLGPTAANQNTARILNPTNSGVIAVVESIELIEIGASANSFSVSYATNLPNLGSLDITTSIDGRNASASAVIASHVNALAAVGANLFGFATSVQNAFQCINCEDQEIVLTPGASLSFLQSVVNTNWQYCAIWRERFLEESERI